MMTREAYEEIDATLEHIKMMMEASTETSESHGFKTDHWCVFASVEEREGIHIQRYLIEEEEVDDQCVSHFLLSDTEMEEKFQVLVVAENK
jgi:hypothetical protein